MEPQVIQTIADKLDGAKQSRKPIATLTESYEGFTVADAYQVQFTNINRELKRGRSIVGKKIGLTSKGMQQMLGVAEPRTTGQRCCRPRCSASAFEWYRGALSCL